MTQIQKVVSLGLLPHETSNNHDILYAGVNSALLQGFFEILKNSILPLATDVKG